MHEPRKAAELFNSIDDATTEEGRMVIITVQYK